MTDDPTFDRLVGESLAHHGRGVDERRGDLADVLRRVDRRRSRRRGTAVVGSVLAVGLGAAGIVLVGGPAGDPAVGDGGPAATDDASAWGCTGLVSWDGTADYYASCEPFPGGALPTAPVVVPPATSVVEGPVASTIAAFPSTPEPTMPEPTTTVTWPAAPPESALPTSVGSAVPGATLPPVTNAPVCESAVATVPCASAVPSTLAPSVSPSPTVVLDSAFRCTGPLGNDLTHTFYRSCERVPWASVPAPVAPTTVPSNPSFAPAAPVATTEPPRAGYEQSYTVVEGDTLTAIGERYGVDVQILVAYNAWPEGIDRLLLVGDIVKIPPGSRIP